MKCQTCKVDGPVNQCANCKLVFYCSRACQKADWPRHRTQCQFALQRGKKKESVMKPPLGVTEEPTIKRHSTTVRIMKPNPVALRTEEKPVIEIQPKRIIKSEDIPVYFANYQFYSTGQENKHLIIVLPGEGTDAKDYQNFIQHINIQNCCYLVLQPPQELPFYSGWSWYPTFDANSDFITPAEEDNKRVTGLIRTRKWIARLLQTLIQQWPEENIFFFGYSQGATTALDFVFHSGYTNNFGGVVCVSDSILDEALFQNFVEPYPDKLIAPLPPVFISHGEKDRRVSIQAAKCKVAKLHELYAERGSKSMIQFESYEKGHQMVSSKAELEAIVQFFKTSMKSQHA